MAPDPNTSNREPLNKLLNDLVDAKLEQRQADIERLEREIGQRQARGEGPNDWPSDHCDQSQF
jgi:hypothetical protein